MVVTKPKVPAFSLSSKKSSSTPRTRCIQATEPGSQRAEIKTTKITNNHTPEIVTERKCQKTSRVEKKTNSVKELLKADSTSTLNSGELLKNQTCNRKINKILFLSGLVFGKINNNIFNKKDASLGTNNVSFILDCELHH